MGLDSLWAFGEGCGDEPTEVGVVHTSQSIQLYTGESLWGKDQAI